MLFFILNIFKINLFSANYFIFISDNEEVFIRKAFKNSYINLEFYRVRSNYKLKKFIFGILYMIINKVNFIDFLISKYILYKNYKFFDINSTNESNYK